MDVDSGGTEWHHSWGSFAMRAHAHMSVPVPVCVPVSVYQCLCESGTSFLGGLCLSVGQAEVLAGSAHSHSLFSAFLANIINILCCIISAISWVAFYNLRRSTSDSIMTRCFMQLPAASVSGGEKHLINCKTTKEGVGFFFNRAGCRQKTQ